MSVLFYVLWVTMMLSITVVLLLVFDFLNALKRDHRAIWKELGEPSLFLNNSLRNNFLVVRFLYKRQYLQLEGEIFREKAARLRMAYIVALILFVLTLIALLFAGQPSLGPFTVVGIR